MPQERPETVFCLFRVKAGREEELVKLLGDHGRLLRRLGLAIDEPMAVYRGSDERERPFLIELFQWKSARALDAARKHPEVQDLWERMEPLCEPRDGRPGMEFPHVERLAF
jgi:hypothetical protein